MLNQPSHLHLQTLEDLDLPSLEEIELIPTKVLRFFADYEHVAGADCPCVPSLQRFSDSATGYSFVHNRFNLVDPTQCFLDE